MQSAVRPVLDHLVLPTADLDVVCRRLAALGFTVAPEGVHPFGTRNACVYFEDGSFIEPLAIGDGSVASAAASSGNAFVARDHAYRDYAGDEGFSALVLASHDADHDHERFVAQGIAAGERLDFSRAYRDAEGNERAVSFKLAFAAQPETSGAFFFTCERVDAPAGGRGALAEHANGVTGISSVIATSIDLSRDAAFLSSFTGVPIEPTVGGIALRLSSSVIEIVEPDHYLERFGHPAPEIRIGLRLAAISFSCPDLSIAKRLFAASGIDQLEVVRSVIVPSALGQGAAFIFEDHS